MRRLLTAALIALLPLDAAAEDPALPGIADSGLIEANGIRHYYEVRGQGEPFLLLHGGLGSSDMFAPVLPQLAEGRQVILVDLHGHGRTELGERPMRYEAMADDMAAILDALGHEKIDVMGYSLGGGVALRLAIQHPERVDRLALVSAGYAHDALFPEILEQVTRLGGQMAPMMQDTPMYKGYVAVAPDPDAFPDLLDRLGELERQPFDWSDEVRALRMPVLLAYGDSDMIRPEHAVDFYQLLGGGLRDAGWQREHMAQNRLAILPGLTHYDTFLSPETVRVTRGFLDGRQTRSDWAAPAQN
ncbi:alpha/beta fold hydrolase [Rhodobacteraceae bacterium 2CG4]|uniref:Alpha/beta fold hydrolase n=1 Tax=Halovulum marinum TaxID=2662447 RepID=A0A6L5YXR6_9RHOB|nr:alpha/beta hydrolase [Halovulum marinum]MSU88779.1 alpha/beta fold hydrolase [Halovulum marinum]